LINTGVYDVNREFHTTVSPSMDILISSNLERLLYHICKNDDKVINDLFSSLRSKGKFEVDKKIKTKLKSVFYGGWCSEEDTSKTIKEVYDEYGYLMDTHTAVGYKVYSDYINGLSGASAAEKKTKTIIAATANPYKFSEAVYSSLFGKFVPQQQQQVMPIDNNDDNFGEEVQIKDLPQTLEERTSIAIPKPLVGIKDKEVRFTEVIETSGIKNAVINILLS